MDGANFEGAKLEVSAGSFGRTVSNFEIGGNNGQFAFYANVEYFDEDARPEDDTVEYNNEDTFTPHHDDDSPKTYPSPA